MCNPYSNDEKMNTLYELKHQCMVKNNVKILSNNECKKFIDYVNKTYGRTLLENARSLA